jgi:hypothetical protein
LADFVAASVARIEQSEIREQPHRTTPHFATLNAGYELHPERTLRTAAISGREVTLWVNRAIRATSSGVCFTPNRDQIATLRQPTRSRPAVWCVIVYVKLQQA